MLFRRIQGTDLFQYDYRHTDMELFSTVAKTLDECRKQRDEWIAKKKRNNNNINKYIYENDRSK